MQRIRILLADDHALVREGTRELLERESDLEVVAEASDGQETVALAVQACPDVALVDIAMPKLNGIEATRKIKELCPSTAVLILTAYDDDQYVFALLEAGAAGYLLKNVRGRNLVEAVRAVHAGESVLHPVIARKVIDHFTRSADKPQGLDEPQPLTERELDVLKLAAKGMSNRDIAHHLDLSTRTIQAHLSAIFGKLDAGSRTEAVVRALREGWIDLDETA
ncbi:MAG: response regulator transcription factor [Anaerolineae bacterium]|nr:response regulator transcription factor [Anaerolineae bacterium]